MKRALEPRPQGVLPRFRPRVDALLPVGHTGNTVPTLTVKISKQLRSRLVAAARRRGVTQSDLVRQAIEHALLEDPLPGPSAYDLIADLIEKLPKPKGPPTDRSTNKKYLEGYGLDNRQYRKKYGRDRRPR